MNMPPGRDAHGQPIAAFPALLIQNYGKAIDQLIGMSRGVLADGVLNDAEIVHFRRWIEATCEVEQGFPFDELAARFSRVFADGRIDDEEREELAEIMRQLSGISDDAAAMEQLSTGLPLDRPPPDLIFTGREFVVTGRCAFGTRARVWEKIESLGGTVNDHPRHKTHYLVIGHFASRDWVHTSYGRKIERAVELRRDGHQIRIVSEEHWRSRFAVE